MKTKTTGSKDSYTPYFQTLLEVMKEQTDGIENFKTLDFQNLLLKFNEKYRNSVQGKETDDSINSQNKDSLSRKIYLVEA